MATKAAKSLTINATTFQLANKLAIDPQTGKLQLIAKDVVLDEVEIVTKPVINLLVDGFYIKDWCQNHSQFVFPASPSFSFTDADGNALTYTEFIDKALGGYTIVPWFKFDSSSNFEPYYKGEAKPIDATGSIEIYIPIDAWTVPGVRPVGGGDDLRDFFSVIAIVNPDDTSRFPAIRPAVEYIRKNFSTGGSVFAVNDTFEMMNSYEGFRPKYVEICAPGYDAYIKVLPTQIAYNNDSAIGVSAAMYDAGGSNEIVMQTLTIKLISQVYTVTAIA